MMLSFLSTGVSEGIFLDKYGYGSLALKGGEARSAYLSTMVGSLCEFLALIVFYVRKAHTCFYVFFRGGFQYVCSLIYERKDP